MPWIEAERSGRWGGGVKSSQTLSITNLQKGHKLSRQRGLFPGTLGTWKLVLVSAVNREMGGY